MKTFIAVLIIAMSMLLSGCTPDGIGITPAPQSQG